MAHYAAPKSIDALNSFRFERILNEDLLTHTLIVLGTLLASNGDQSTIHSGERVPAIIRVEKTALDAAQTSTFFGEKDGLVKKVEIVESTDIYTWLFGWLGENRECDLKINVICPATEVHIRKYTKQQQIMVRETPELYEQIVKPYILAFPASRTQWVENILTGISEQSKILFSSPAFLLLPDMKWDLKTVSSLYLLAIVQDRAIRSLRDLRHAHLPLLKDIRLEAGRIAKERWGMGNEYLRMYIHYQPSYYHFHVHIVNVNYEGGLLGMTVGQAHLLDDVISLLELDTPTSPGIFERLTLTYGLGDQHGLFKPMRSAMSPGTVLSGA
ncbi:scavenger mRNA decapping enzyme [Crucibulum laeve]|uniref:Scavenger mRNA decapping enzyme n=1 Tax=Crucibulum laeve TaxID=68775 RepID=A0A5C3MFJ8_9AGAR|nr:scavenger mRNA decapping enzyme [Crucibulum laeve]